jgi:2-dehydro-3-deoxygalactonokinase
MVTPVSATPRLVALDWGSTRLRAWLLGEHGAVLAERQNASGASTLAGGPAAFEQALAGLAADWLDSTIPVVACGMVGSAHGWREAPYVACPARLDVLHEHLVEVKAGAATMRIVPGLIDDPAGAAPDVMRGEETQVLGLVKTRPDLAARACVLMPGTHSKWVQLTDGAVTGLRTRMTGEAYALLRQHSVLARQMLAEDTPLDREAFAAGVVAARDAQGRDLLAQLFSVRTLGLTRRWPAAALPDHLSGLLIGHELVAGLGSADGPLALVGEPALCRRYALALDVLGASAVTVGTNTACAGLWQLAVQAGWVPA